MATKFPIIENAKRQARMCFKGLAIPVRTPVEDAQFIIDVDYVHGVNNRKRYVMTEKVLKFNRTALKNIGKDNKEKANPRYIGGEDTMIVPVGRPGSRERVEELAKQYGVVEHLEISPFNFKDEE